MAQTSTTPTTVQMWRARPIFVSSTFRDMHAERDWLRDHAFLRLGDRLRERCHYLSTIDLRQGVENTGEADEAARELQVLKVCLDEIERSRPFLVTLLGDRYGWIPPAERIVAAARTAGLPETVTVEGKSVTELEVLYGVLENPDQRRRSWFYFRTLDRSAMPPEESARFPAEDASDDPASPAGLLRTLKERIRRELPDRVRDYTLTWDPERQELTGLDELDRRIEDDLWRDLEAETAEYLRTAPATWQQAEARQVADFVAERTRNFVDRPAVSDPMLALALSPAAPRTDWGLVLCGEAGGGKSSLFGRLYQSLSAHAQAGEIVLLAHAAGIFPQSGQVDRMLRRWVTELAAHLELPDPLAEYGAGPEREFGLAGERQKLTSEDVDNAFAEMLGRASVLGRVVVLIDALNQFEPTTRAKHLTWLPRLWPDNARLLATAIDGPAADALRQRPGCHALDMPAVTADEARQIAARFYRERYHRAVNPQVLETLLAKPQPDGRPAHGNPLWLALALQEMNLLEADDYEQAERDFVHLPGAERMQALQLAEAERLPASATGLYNELLARAGRLCGPAQVEAFVSFIAVSRSGWRDSDLSVLIPQRSGAAWDELAFANLRRVLGSHVVQRGAHGQWDFFHAALRSTVLERLGDEAAQKQLHGLIADHLERLDPADPLRISESMVHLLGLGDQERAAEYLEVMLLAQQWATQVVEAEAAIAAAVAVLAETVQSAADENEALHVTDWITELLAGKEVKRDKRLAFVFIYYLNDALSITGKQSTEQARGRILEVACCVLKRLSESNPNDAQVVHGFAVSQNKLGDFYMRRGGSGDMQQAMDVYQSSLKINQRLNEANPNDAQIEHGFAVSLVKLVDFHLRRKENGDTQQALDACQLALKTFQSLNEANPNDAQVEHGLAVSLVKLGDCYLMRGGSGDMQQAMDVYQSSLEINQRLNEANPNDAQVEHGFAVSLLKLGDLSDARGKWGCSTCVGGLPSFVRD